MTVRILVIYVILTYFSLVESYTKSNWKNLLASSTSASDLRAPFLPANLPTIFWGGVVLGSTPSCTGTELHLQNSTVFRDLLHWLASCVQAVSGCNLLCWGLWLFHTPPSVVPDHYQYPSWGMLISQQMARFIDSKMEKPPSWLFSFSLLMPCKVWGCLLLETDSGRLGAWISAVWPGKNGALEKGARIFSRWFHKSPTHRVLESLKARGEKKKRTSPFG